ncbi:MAG: hypothetical protein AABW99_04665 [archaeon]
MPERTITFRELFKNDKSSRPFFPTSIRVSLPRKSAQKQETRVVKRSRLFQGSASHRGRLPFHVTFLKQKREEIKVFADLGCALELGAPTTVDARKALGNDAKVYAIDTYDVEFEDGKLRDNLLKKFTPLKHSISTSPLPFQCDAIRFANVSYYMSESDRRRAVYNIWKSLRAGGFLLGSTQYFEGGKPVEHQFILKKTERGFVEVAFSKKQ